MSEQGAEKQGPVALEATGRVTIRIEMTLAEFEAAIRARWAKVYGSPCPRIETALEIMLTNDCGFPIRAAQLIEVVEPAEEACHE